MPYIENLKITVDDDPITPNSWNTNQSSNLSSSFGKGNDHGKFLSVPGGKSNSLSLMSGKLNLLFYSFCHVTKKNKKCFIASKDKTIDLKRFLS